MDCTQGPHQINAAGAVHDARLMVLRVMLGASTCSLGLTLCDMMQSSMPIEDATSLMQLAPMLGIAVCSTSWKVEC